VSSSSHIPAAHIVSRHCTGLLFASTVLFQLASTHKSRTTKIASDIICKILDTVSVSSWLVRRCITNVECRSSAFDLYDGTLYCMKCDDVVYNARFQETLSIEQRRASGSGGSRTSAGQITNGDGKDGGPSICRGEYRPRIGFRPSDRCRLSVQCLAVFIIWEPLAL
jgi:hypothetical protein